MGWRCQPASDVKGNATADAELKTAVARTRAELAKSVAQTALDIADRVASTKRSKWVLDVVRARRYPYSLGGVTVWSRLCVCMDVISDTEQAIRGYRRNHSPLPLPGSNL